MHVTIDTSQPLSATDRQLLALLLGQDDTTEEPTPKPVPEKKATPAKKAAAPKPEPEPEPEEDLINGDSDEGPTLDDAIAKATELVAAGKGAEVKAALAKTSAKRVSLLAGDDIATFLNELG